MKFIKQIFVLVILFVIKIYSQEIEIVTPLAGEIVWGTYRFYIEWKGLPGDEVYIQFTSDAGVNWINIDCNNHVKSIWAEENLTPSDRYKVRIFKRDDPNIMAETEGYFTVLNLDYDSTSINNIHMWMGNDGSFSHNPVVRQNGFYWYNNSTQYTLGYIDGLTWAGKINGDVKANGCLYRSGLIPGKTKPRNFISTQNDPQYKIFRIIKDWESLKPSELKTELELNYKNWPMALGAPYIDLMKDGKYTPGVDRPKFIGDETIWYVSNDSDIARTKYVFGADPMGLEIQTTAFAFKDGRELDDVVFKKYKIINNGSNYIEDFYMGYFMDPEILYGANDLHGCDTTLNLAFTYNGEPTETNWSDNLIPPAVGYQIVQGPIVASFPDDSAMFCERWIRGYKNLPLTAFFGYINSDNIYDPPDEGIKEGALQCYNNLRGLLRTGANVIDPISGNKTAFMLSGDPFNKTGWYDGKPLWKYAGQRYSMMSSGPFNMAPGDTQEVVIAVIVGYGQNNLHSVIDLKLKAAFVHEYYKEKIFPSLYENNIAPDCFYLSQNFPNPFNPITKIRYELPIQSHVILSVYDILGRKVSELVKGISKNSN